MRIIFYSALESAPSTKKVKITEAQEFDALDDTDKVLEALKRDQSTYNDDNLEISKSPSQLNRFGALQLDEDKDGQQQSEMQINREELHHDDDEEYEDEDDDEEENTDQSEEEENDQETLVEQIREDVLAYEKLPENKKKNLSLTVNREELIHLLRCFYSHQTTVRENILTIGMVRQWFRSLRADSSALFMTGRISQRRQKFND